MIVERRTTAAGLVPRHRAALTARLQELADTYRHTAEVLDAVGDYDRARQFRAKAVRLNPPGGDRRG
jgi:hypothetical protein